MESEYLIGVIGNNNNGSGESEIGQENTTNSLNLDFINSWKTVNNSPSRHCIISLRNVDTESDDKGLDFSVIKLIDEPKPLKLDPAALLSDVVVVKNNFEEENNNFMDNVASDEGNIDWELEPIILVPKAASFSSVSEPQAGDVRNENNFSLRTLEQELEDHLLNHATVQNTDQEIASASKVLAHTFSINHNPPHFYTLRQLSADGHKHSAPAPSPSTSHQHLYNCTYCDKTFNQRVNLDHHERIHTGKKLYKCQRCPKKFAQYGNLKSHLRVHTGEKPFKCRRCRNKFTQLSQLRNHVRVHTGEKPFKCPFCAYGSNLRGKRNTHVAKHHPNENPKAVSINNNVKEKQKHQQQQLQ